MKENGQKLASFKDAGVNLSDFALFLSVMKHAEAHESVLSIIMDEPDLKLARVHVEEVVLNAIGKGQFGWMRGQSRKTSANL